MTRANDRNITDGKSVYVERGTPTPVGARVRICPSRPATSSAASSLPQACGASGSAPARNYVESPSWSTETRDPSVTVATPPFSVTVSSNT